MSFFSDSNLIATLLQGIFVGRRSNQLGSCPAPCAAHPELQFSSFSRFLLICFDCAGCRSPRLTSAGSQCVRWVFFQVARYAARHWPPEYRGQRGQAPAGASNLSTGNHFNHVIGWPPESANSNQQLFGRPPSLNSVPAPVSLDQFWSDRQFSSVPNARDRKSRGFAVVHVQQGAIQLPDNSVKIVIANR